MESEHAPNILADMQSFGEALAGARKRMKLTQSDVAKRAGISLATVTRMERGEPGVAFGSVMAAVDIVFPQLMNQLIEGLVFQETEIVENVERPARTRAKGF